MTLPPSDHLTAIRDDLAHLSDKLKELETSLYIRDKEADTIRRVRSTMESIGQRIWNERDTAFEAERAAAQ